MFAQFIIAEDAGRDAFGILEQWMDELRPQAIGWLGSTVGVTPDDELVVLARFASEEEARRNSDRPEQDAWWTRAQKQLHGKVTFHDCADVAPVLGGGSDAAGFVQLIVSRPSEQVTAARIAEETSRWVREYRPDVIGGLVAVDADGTILEMVYFTSEEDARAHEAQELPDEARTAMEAFNERLGDPVYYDLPAPRLLS